MSGKVRFPHHTPSWKRDISIWGFINIPILKYRYFARKKEAMLFRFHHPPAPPNSTATMSHSQTTLRRTIVKQSRRTTAAMVGTSAAAAQESSATPTIPMPPPPPLSPNSASMLASDNPVRTAGSRLQLLLVELDEPLPHRSRVAGVFSDGTTMVAAEIDGSALARYVAGNYYEGDSLVLDQIHPPTTGSVGLPVISAISAPRVMKNVVGNPTYIADPDVYQPARVLQRERMLLNDPKECCYALSFARMNGLLFGFAALFTPSFTVQVVSAPQIVTVNARNLTQVYVTDGNDVALFAATCVR